MKKLCILTLVAAAFTLPAADAIFRVDFNSGKDQIILTPEKNDSMNAVPMNWVKDPEARKYTLTATSRKKVSAAEWKDYEITFVPSKSGSINITVGGQWAAKPEDRAWLLVNKFEVNDKLYANGDFKKTFTGKNGRVIPNGFSIGGKAKYLPTAGEKGTPAILVNHDNRIGFNMKVEAGKKYELEFGVKAATPDLLK